jgi:hypothetical protein
LSAHGPAEAKAILTRRALIATSALSLRSLRRIVAQVAAANWMWVSPMQRRHFGYSGSKLAA